MFHIQRPSECLKLKLNCPFKRHEILNWSKTDEDSLVKENEFRIKAKSQRQLKLCVIELKLKFVLEQSSRESLGFPTDPFNDIFITPE